jgi:hypothetical protein
MVSAAMKARMKKKRRAHADTPARNRGRSWRNAGSVHQPADVMFDARQSF